ncbi:uncharacterized protein LOC131205773 [Anopheles bellator]|uniref:uncharacterized protein LOC131205773 n=1 Tax=Anopheles bellator TaxID=139047 RepID=UPI0026474D08|nr:uncharacterized protein LOC131205773 [Anopheles bellator]
MSLRAIQKRDREKLSSSQRQQQPQLISGHSQRTGVGSAPLLMPYDGTATTTATKRMTAAGDNDIHSIVPSVQSNIQNKNAKGKAGAAVSNAFITRPLPLASAYIRRCSSHPTLLSTTHGTTSSPVFDRTKWKLRSVKSESDLQAARDRPEHSVAGFGPGTAATVGIQHSGSGSFSTSNFYLGAKSEVCLKTLAVKNTLPYVSTSLMMQQPQQHQHQSNQRSLGHGAGDNERNSRATITPPSKRLYESRRTSELAASDFGANKSNNARIAAAAASIRIPIVGYEVMEERARFTIFKLRIENSISHSCWLVLRRYTDFVRLNNKLKSAFPHCNLVLPRKKWFGDNFSTGFIDNRIQGLQAFINIILGDDAMRTCQAVRDFFCLDEPPPSYSESMEESRVIFEAQEERISELRQQLQTKEDLIQTLQKRLATETNRNTILSNVLRNTAENCAKCAKCIDQQLKESVFK